MGKQAKKKEKNESQVTQQRRHNPATRGVNTFKKGVVWALREIKKGDEVEVYEVVVPRDTGFNPHDKNRGAYRAAFVRNGKMEIAWKTNKNAHEPFDSMALDWREEMMHYAVDNNARIGRKNLPNGKFLYRVFQGGSIDKPDILFFEIESASKLILKKGRKGQRR